MTTSFGWNWRRTWDNSWRRSCGDHPEIEWSFLECMMKVLQSTCFVRWDGRSACNSFFFLIGVRCINFCLCCNRWKKVYYNLWNQRLLSTFVIQSLVKCNHKMIGLITRSVLWYYPNIGTSTLSDNWIVDSERSHTCFCYIPVYLHRGIFKIKGCEL